MTGPEKALIAAVLDRLIPSDRHGPGALESGVMRYLERALAGPYAAHQATYASGLAALDRHARMAHGRGFCELAPDAQDAALAALERGEGQGLAEDSAAFFAMVRTHAIEGMFGDPRWGGNRGFAGWDLLGYGGVRRVWTAEEQQLDVVVPPVHQGHDELEGGSR